MASSAELRIQFILRTADSVHLVLTRCNCVYYCRARPIGKMTRQFIYLYFYIKNTWKLNDLRFLPSKIHILGNIVMIMNLIAYIRKEILGRVISDISKKISIPYRIDAPATLFILYIKILGLQQAHRKGGTPDLAPPPYYPEKG